MDFYKQIKKRASSACINSIFKFAFRTHEEGFSYFINLVLFTVFSLISYSFGSFLSSFEGGGSSRGTKLVHEGFLRIQAVQMVLVRAP